MRFTRISADVLSISVAVPQSEDFLDDVLSAADRLSDAGKDTARSSYSVLVDGVDHLVSDGLSCDNIDGPPAA